MARTFNFFFFFHQVSMNTTNVSIFSLLGKWKLSPCAQLAVSESEGWMWVLFSGNFIVSGMIHASPQVDDNVGLLMSELERIGLWGRINVVITSDHGMTQCSSDRVIRLDDCLHPDNYTALELSPVASIIPLAGNQITSEISRAVQFWRCFSEVPFVICCRPRSRLRSVKKVPPPYGGVFEERHPRALPLQEQRPYPAHPADCRWGLDHRQAREQDIKM